MTRRPREPHRRNGGWRHPPPSGSPSGPVGPSDRNSNPDFPVQPRRPLGATCTLGAQEVAVKATLPLARGVLPAQDGRITSMEFPVMSRRSGQSRPSAHRFSGTATAVARTFAAGAPLQAASRLRPQGAAQPAPNSNARPRTGFPGMRAVSSQLESNAGPSLTGRALGVP
jgi:hypothetical protein